MQVSLGLPQGIQENQDFFARTSPRITWMGTRRVRLVGAPAIIAIWTSTNLPVRLPTHWKRARWRSKPLRVAWHKPSVSDGPGCAASHNVTWLASAGRCGLAIQRWWSFLRRDPGFRGARANLRERLHIVHRLTAPQQMRPAPVARAWAVRPLESAGALADWLGLEPNELAWFADLQGMLRSAAIPRLHHYVYRLGPKRSGGVRLIESPKLRLKTMQRRILFEILNQIPLHDAAHGFRRGRSIRTFAAPHVGQRLLLRMDLRDFFPSIGCARVQALFRTVGYPEPVADLLGGICSNTAPRHIFHLPGVSIQTLIHARDLYTYPHLPQGAPTSPAIANACAYRLDCRLTGLARAAGARYTRYADDLAFSGDDVFVRRASRFADHVGSVLLEEGFEANYGKTRIMHSGTRQHLAGLVVNDHLNIGRVEFDGLKATLTNCTRLGVQSQNRDAHPEFRAHLEGRVSHVAAINSQKGAKLRAIFDRIDWTAFNR
jgi:RNA-directed DNA polymerase